MNLNELFNIQAKLDERIEKEHGLEGQDLLDKKILALQVELGELANEQRSWKFWSKDQEPTKKKNVYLECGACEGSGIDECKSDEILETVTCEECEGDGDLGIAYTKNPLLEERSEEHTSELQSRGHLVCRLLLEKTNDSRSYNQNI